MAKKSKKSLAAILVMCILIVTAGCEEAPAPNQGEQAVRATTAETTTEKTTETSETTTESEKTTEEEKPANLEGLKINTDLLEDFGLTLSELEKKYGEAVKGDFEKIKGYETEIYTYFFESGTRGYTFVFDEFNINEKPKEKKLPDGTPRTEDVDSRGNRIEYIFFNGEVKDLFLGMDKPVTLAQLKETCNARDSMDEMFLFEWNGDYYSIQLTKLAHGVYEHNRKWNGDDSIIDQDCFLSIGYYRDGAGFQGW